MLTPNFFGGNEQIESKIDTHLSLVQDKRAGCFSQDVCGRIQHLATQNEDGVCQVFDRLQQ